MIPYEIWTNEQLFLEHMRIIDCVIWVYIFKKKRKKLDERNKKCYLIDYNDIFIFRV